MGIGAGYFLGGMNQGVQDNIANRQRQQIIDMSQAEENRRSTLFDEQQSDSSAGKDAALQNLFASIPAPNAPAPGGEPGQASVPGQSRMPPGMTGFGGAQTQPVQPQAPQAPQPMPPMPPQQGKPQTPQQPGPAGQQMPQVPGQQPMQPAQQPAPNGQQAPQGTQDPIENALSALNRANQQLQEPTAMKISADPGVVKAQTALSSFVAKLRKDGHDPTVPGGSRPDEVETARLMLLQQGLTVAAGQAATHVTEDRKNAVAMAQEYTKVWVGKEHADAILKSAGIRADGQRDAATIRGPSGSGRAAGATPEIDTLSTSQKGQVEQQIKAYQATGRFIPGTGYNDPIKRVALAEMERRGLDTQGAVANKSDNAADTNAVKLASAKLAILEPAYSAFEKNSDYMLTLAKEYGLKGNQPLNSIANKIRSKSGSVAAEKFLASITTVQTEYGKILTASTSASGTPIAALKKAEGSVNSSMTLEQLIGVGQVLKVDGQNVITGFKDKVKSSGDAMRNRGSAGAGKAAGGGGGGGYVSKEGEPFTADSLAETAKNNHMTVDELASQLGMTRGK
jgi:LysM repeat protein